MAWFPVSWPDLNEKSWRQRNRFTSIDSSFRLLCHSPFLSHSVYVLYMYIARMCTTRARPYLFQESKLPILRIGPKLPPENAISVLEFLHRKIYVYNIYNKLYIYILVRHFWMWWYNFYQLAKCDFFFQLLLNISINQLIN